MENMLKREVPINKGLNIVNAMVAVLVGIIVGIAAVVPVTTEVVSNAGLTGTNKTIAELLPTLVLISLLVLVSQLM